MILPDYKSYSVSRNNKEPLRFLGLLIARAASSPDSDNSQFSGVMGEWVEFSLYLRQIGGYVCQICHFDCSVEVAPVKAHYSVSVCDTEKEIRVFFGVNNVAKRLYAKAQEKGVICN